jgi:hypothetical protein
MLFSRKRIRWYAREWIAAALCLTALGVAVAVFFSQSRPRRYRLSISGGNAQGLRHQIAERLAVEAVRHGLGVQIVPSSGSREVLDLVEAHTLDLAFVQGGLDPAIHPHVRQIAALHVEPLHLLVKPALFNYLNRLILHERDNLEDRAVTERRTAESVWNEALAGSNAGIPVPEDAVERPVLIESRVETSSH